MAIHSPNKNRNVVKTASLPENWPTCYHSPSFWEQLGRTIAIFGLLEEVLGKAIFAFTGTRRYQDEEAAEKAYQAWLPTLERALSDPLGPLADSYIKAVTDNLDATVDGIDDFADDIKKAASIRNVLCHGSWRKPDAEQKSMPFFVDRHLRKFETQVDIPFLKQVQSHTVGLVLFVINSVTSHGWQFPGSTGPGAKFGDLHASIKNV